MTNDLPIMPATTTKNYAVIFPGQGSQSVGMLADWAEVYPKIIDLFAQASQVIGVDLWAICQGQHPEISVDDTRYTQPALLTASMAIWQILCDELDIKPTYLAGHSLGEYSALCAAGVLSFDEAVALVYQRGQYMTAAMQNQSGKMAAIMGLDDDAVEAVCQQVQAENSEAKVSPANFNAPGQVVIAGNTLGVETAIQAVNSLGKKAIPLNVSVPSHCQLMQPASDQLSHALNRVTFKAPKITVIQNRHARVEADSQAIKQALIEQLSMPVLWSTIENSLAEHGIELQIECGSGTVLTNLAKRQQHKITTLATDKVSKLDSIRDALSVCSY